MVDNFQYIMHNYCSLFSFYKLYIFLRKWEERMDNSVNDNGGFLWGLLGFCIPIVGLILFLVWKDQKPNTAKAAGIGALVSVILGVLLYIVLFVIIGVGAVAFGA